MLFGKKKPLYLACQNLHKGVVLKDKEKLEKQEVFFFYISKGMTGVQPNPDNGTEKYI